MSAHLAPHLRREPVEPARGRFSVEDTRAAWEAQDGCCAHCGARLTHFHKDHVLPVELDGKTTLANLQLLCVPCHKVKTAGDLDRINKAKRLARDADPSTRRRPPFRIRSKGFQGADPLKERR